MNKCFTDSSKHITTFRVTSQSLKTFRVIIMCCKVCSLSQISPSSCKGQQRGGANRTDKALSRAFKFKISIEKLNQSPPLSFLQYPKTLRYFVGMWGHSRGISALAVRYFPSFCAVFNMCQLQLKEYGSFMQCLGLLCEGFVENGSLVNISVNGTESAK